MDPEELLDHGSTLPYLASEHVALINSIRPTFGQLNADGLFPTDGLDTPFVRIDMVNGVIRALPVTPEGRPSTIAGRQTSEGRIVEIPNVSHEDSVLAGDIRKWLALARRSRHPEETLVNQVETRHRRNRLKFEITQEVMKISALKGRIVDGAGELLYDLYDLFGLQERVVYFDLADPNTDVPGKIEEVIGSTEDALVDEVMDGVEVRVGPDFYNALIRHPSVEKYYQGTPAMLAQLLNQQREKVNGHFRRTIEIAGLVFKEYRPKVTLWGSEVPVRLVAAGEGHAYPTGTLDTHATYAAPPLDIRVLDEGGSGDVDDLIHMTMEPKKHGEGEEWKYQMNALPIWKRPALLTRLSAAEGP
jgi:hypothetical protein